MVNKISNTPMAINSYNARGIITNHYVTQNCMRQANGILWAIIGHWGGNIQLINSIDDGFSWNVILPDLESGLDMREQADFNADGLITHLVISERWDNLDVYMGEWEYLGGTGTIERSRYSLSGLLGSAPEDVVETNTTITGVTDCYQAMCYVTSQPDEAFVVWVKTSPSNIYITRCAETSTSIGNSAALSGYTNYGYLAAVADGEDHIFIVFSHVDGSDKKITAARYNIAANSWTNAVLIENIGTTGACKDLHIMRDGYGTLCCCYFDTGDGQVRYSMSMDDGATWSAPVSLTRTTGHGLYNDSITGDPAGRCSLIGGSQGGYLLTYVEDNSDAIPRTYIRQITTTDGVTYTLGDEREIATAEVWEGQPITGAHFFVPTDTKLMDISDPGLVRVAFTVGEGNSTIMSDSVPVTFGQELLRESAYPTSLTSETSQYTIDTPDADQLLVLFDIFAGPNDNVDFYAAGLIGGFTTRYKSAFNRIGTAIRILKYEPKADNYMDDISAFGAPEEYETLALFDPVTYSFPSPALNRSTTLERIEQDVRKMHLPADFPLLRTFLVNKGGYLKRTVYLAEYDGNQYELSQVIPRFINNQICFYEVNAYVVGPSRDPFSRVVLPSET